MNNKLKCYYMLLGIFPILFTALFILLIIRVRLHLGYWPSYNNPDPQHVEFTIHWLLVAWTGVGSIITFILWLISAFIQTFWLKIKFEAKYMIFTLTWLLVFFLIYIDAGGFVKWFVD